MPRQNRVTPFGEIIATPARGTLMGNRGRLHDAAGQIKRPYNGKRWIICRLRFKNRRRIIMAPHSYTELFFLDEATALAAGHRPCAECFRPRYNEFVASWSQANSDLMGQTPLTADRVDAILHQERLNATRQKMTYSASIVDLPDGSFITFDGQQAYLVLGDALLVWQPEGYGQRLARLLTGMVTVLTPHSVVKTLAAGYQPEIHASAY